MGGSHVIVVLVAYFVVACLAIVRWLALLFLYYVFIFRFAKSSDIIDVI